MDKPWQDMVPHETVQGYIELGGLELTAWVISHLGQKGFHFSDCGFSKVDPAVECNLLGAPFQELVLLQMTWQQCFQSQCSVADTNSRHGRCDLNPIQPYLTDEEIEPVICVPGVHLRTISFNARLEV
uniref:Uncharacterized protein n=1 Tax=Cacopsylla melanoneura TaxID=428564 RepID=A0A8D8ZAL5_9HEMI